MDSLTEKFMTIYLEHIQEGLQEAGEDPDCFTPQMVKDIVADAIEFQMSK